MTDLELIKEIAQPSPAKIVLIVVDGLGGLPHPETGKTELETARTPNLDQLASKGTCGLTEPVGLGITPGSGPGHLALFGYDPIRYGIGRGVLEAMGIDFDLEPGDVAARGNFCTVNKGGLVTDRRAGRISTEKCAGLCRLLDGMQIEDVRIFVSPVKEHRFVLVLRGKDLSTDISDSDPEKAGLGPKPIIAGHREAIRTASIVNKFVTRAKVLLAKHEPANMVLLRGFSKQPHLPPMNEVFKLKPAAIASYPMYRGLAKSVGMEVLKTGPTVEEELATLKQNYAKFDFFFLHFKEADTAGEDGDFARKVKIIEQVDGALSELIALKPDVIVVTGDHSTPALLKGHSWHPVPILLYSKWCRQDKMSKFGESECAGGALGSFPATQVMPLALANALKLKKFGA